MEAILSRLRATKTYSSQFPDDLLLLKTLLPFRTWSANIISYESLILSMFLVLWVPKEDLSESIALRHTETFFFNKSHIAAQASVVMSRALPPEPCPIGFPWDIPCSSGVPHV